MTYEALDQWTYVIGAYALGLGGTALLVAQSWLAMRKAEKRRETSRDKDNRL